MLGLTDGMCSSHSKNGNDFSQFSPCTKRTSQTSSQRSKINLEFESTFPFGSSGLKLPAGLYESSVKKAENTLNSLEPLQPDIAFPEETDVRILEDGTIEFMDDQDLPPMMDDLQLLDQPELARPEPEHQDGQPMTGGDDPRRPTSQHPDVQPSEPVVQEQPIQPQNITSVRRQRRRRRLRPDEITRIPWRQMRSWVSEYVQNQKAARAEAARRTTVPRSKSNAYQFVFGLGVNLIGRDPPPGGASGLHELASHFAGDKLASAVLGEGVTGERRGLKRKTQDGEEHEGERNVQARSQEHPQVRGAPAQADDQPMRTMDDDLVEVGREPRSDLSDHPSLPWSRPQPGTGVKARSAHGSVRAYSSPLAGHFGSAQDFERDLSVSYPYNVGAGNGLGPSDEGDFGQDAFYDRTSKAITHAMRAALDRDGANFLSYLENLARIKGIRRSGDERGLVWIKFDDVVQAPDNTKAVAASAFLHVLTLKTKGVIKVEQEGRERMVPFGQISIGVHLPESELRDQEREDHHEKELDILTQRLAAQSQSDLVPGRKRHKSDRHGQPATVLGSDFMQVDHEP